MQYAVLKTKIYILEENLKILIKGIEICQNKSLINLLLLSHFTNCPGFFKKKIRVKQTPLLSSFSLPTYFRAHLTSAHSIFFTTF